MNRRDFLKYIFSTLAVGALSRNSAEAARLKTKKKTTMNSMIYRTLGRTGIEVSAIALGIESFINKSAAQTADMLHFAADSGINFIDICLTDPDLLARLCEGLKKCPHEFVIQGHAGSIWRNRQYQRSRNMPAVREGFESIFRHLQVEQLDIGMIHYVDQSADLQNILNGEYISYLLQLKKQGRIRSIGLSSHNPNIARQAAESGMIDVLMFSANLAYDMHPGSNRILHDKNRESLYAYCAGKGIAIDVMKAYAGGDLLNEKVSPFGKAFTPVQCLNYALTRPAVSAVMVGCGSISEISQAIAWCQATAQEKDYSQVITGSDKSNWQGHCIYCGHCAPCPAELDIASINKYLNLALAGKDGVPETVREHYLLLKNHASDCVQCGVCEKRCPFGVPVREKMQEAVKVFGK